MALNEMRNTSGQCVSVVDVDESQILEKKYFDLWLFLSFGYIL